MDNQNRSTKLIDWRNRKKAMATYQKYEELGGTGPCYSYYNGELLPAPQPLILTPITVPYNADPALVNKNT